MIAKFYWLLWNNKLFQYLFFNHELMTLHHQLKFVPFGSEGADGVQTSTRHGAQQPVLLLRLLELRQNLHTTSKQHQHNIYTTSHISTTECLWLEYAAAWLIFSSSLMIRVFLKENISHPGVDDDVPQVSGSVIGCV